jgi:hypothetical protein
VGNRVHKPVRQRKIYSVDAETNEQQFGHHDHRHEDKKILKEKNGRAANAAVTPADNQEPADFNEKPRHGNITA